MTNNDVFKILRSLFPLNEAEITDAFSGRVTKSQMYGWRAGCDNRKYRAMTDVELEIILDYLGDTYSPIRRPLLDR